MTESERLLAQIQALAHPARLWIVAYLADGRRAFVTQLAREAGISRPLMKMHLRKLETAGLVISAFETAQSGKAANFYQIAPFAIPLDPQSIVLAGPHPRPGDISTDGASSD
ncbi:transcriptional regulator [Brucella endophytica]|uniref:Transcriptional regulator n=1 Tax=Brucella endophytica TaxID=1963359 RepID=A0A916SCL5_9HYPH|nr:winged helix-turn-helix domain-containing protein [Brucella endophytica]GGA91299.1 transcriptional regulator [Brucella endophytica]